MTTDQLLMEILRRLTRLETRVVKLMMQQGVNPQSEKEDANEFDHNSTQSRGGAASRDGTARVAVGARPPRHNSRAGKHRD